MADLLNKRLLFVFRIYLKIIPVLIGIIIFANTVLSYFECYPKILNYLIVALLFAFIYMASYLLKFCEYHRVFLHYAVVIYILTVIDLYVAIPLSDYNLMILYSILAAISLFITIYLKFKNI